MERNVVSEADPAKLEQWFENLCLSDSQQSINEAIEMFDKARDVCPMPHSSRSGGYYLMLKDKDVRKAMLNWRTFASGPSASRPLAADPADQFRFPPLDFDGEEQSVWRHLFISTVNAKAAERVKDRLRSDVVEILDSMAAKGKADLAVELGDVIPARAIFYLLGIEDTAAQDQIFDANRDMLAEFEDPEKRNANIARMAAFALSEVEKRRANPRDDALTQLAHATKDGRPITGEELAQILTSMLAGGSGTTATAIADLFYEVLSRPQIKQQLIDDPSLIPVAVEESLRLHTPFYGLFRRTTEEVELHDRRLPENSSVLMCWQSANLDPEAFDDPHAFRLDREPGRHLSFGLGRHACPGSPLARMELQLVLSEALSRYPNMALASDDPVAPHFIGGNAVAIPSLPIIFT